MESFNIFQTGGRQKFLKKRKEKKVKTQQENKQLNSVLILQKNIRRFIEYKRSFQKSSNLMELEEQMHAKLDKNKCYDQQKVFLKFWLLTSYHIRTYSLYGDLIQFWKYYSFNQNQVQLKKEFLLLRIIKLTIQFLNKIFDYDFTQGNLICKKIIQLISKQIFKIQRYQVKVLLDTLGSFTNLQIMQILKKQFIDSILQNSQTLALCEEVFLDQAIFIDYLITQNKRNSQNNQIQKLIISFYPKIVQSKQSQICIDQNYSISESKYNQICSLYTQMFKIAKKCLVQNSITLTAFLSNLAKKMKQKIIDQILTNYKINPKIFDSQWEYQQYLEEKQQYFIFKQLLLGNYQQSKQFLTKSFNSILQNKQNSNGTLKNQAIQFVVQLFNLYGDNLQIMPMNKALNFLYENVNQSIIYNIGKQKINFLKSNSLLSQNLLVLLLTIAQKSSQQTPDLYFIKFYQDSEQKQKLKKIIKQILLKILKHTLFLPKLHSLVINITKITINLLQNLYNKIFRTNIHSTQIFQNNSFLTKFKNYQYNAAIKDQVSIFLTQFPFVFSLEQRASKFKQILNHQRHTYHHYGYEQDQDSDDYQNGGNSSHVKIRRNYEFIDAYNQMRKRDLRKYFKVTFINQLGFQEKGIDAGGLKKQFLNRVLKEALNPNYGMFIENQEHELLPHPIKAQLKQGFETMYYQFIGKLIGLALYQNITLGYKFSGIFLNAIVGKKNCFDDLRQIDPDLYKSLIYIKDMQEDARELGLTFMYKDEIRNKHIQLVPNGHLIEVTNQNKKLFISLLTNYKVNKLLEHQTKFIRKGLTSMINKEWLFMFNYEELNYLVSGQGTIDINDLKLNTNVVGFQNQSITIKYFWEILQEFNEQQKSKLLMFVTACPRPSFLGFKQLSPPFTVTILKNGQNKLPISHTCSNVLELPDYKDKQLMRKKLLTAIQSNSGFQFG